MFQLAFSALAIVMMIGETMTLAHWIQQSGASDVPFFTASAIMLPAAPTLVSMEIASTRRR